MSSFNSPWAIAAVIAAVVAAVLFCVYVEVVRGGSDK